MRQGKIPTMAPPLAPTRADTTHRKHPQAYSAAPPVHPQYRCAIVAALLESISSYCHRRWCLALLLTWLLLLFTLPLPTQLYPACQVINRDNPPTVAVVVQVQAPRRVWDPGITVDELVSFVAITIPVESSDDVSIKGRPIPCLCPWTEPLYLSGQSLTVPSHTVVVASIQATDLRVVEALSPNITVASFAKYTVLLVDSVAC